MQAATISRSWLARPAAAWRPSAAPRRRCCRHLRPRCAAAAVDEAASEFSRLVSTGGKLTKTAVSKLAVADLRAECERLQLPSDGLKPALVERLMDWWQQQQQQESSVGQPVTSTENGSQGAAVAAASSVEQAAQASAAAAPMPAVAADTAAPAAAPASSNGNASASRSSSSSDGVARPAQARQGAGVVSATWLGTSSGNPTPRRNVSSIAGKQGLQAQAAGLAGELGAAPRLRLCHRLRFDEDIYLVDCGEGTRNQLRRGGFDPAAIRRVFVTHMHGDHCFGVGGVIKAVCEARLGGPMQHEPLLIYGPPELQSQVLATVRMGAIQLTTPVVVTGWVLDPGRARTPVAADASGMLRMALQGPDQGDRLPGAAVQALQAAYDQGSERVVRHGLSWTVKAPGGTTVSAAQLQHRVPCWGYVFSEAPQAVAPPPSAAAGGAGQPGEAWVRRGRKLVILGDTCDSSAIAPLALGADLLSHEATFCSGMEDKASIAQHSTTEQAGAFAAVVEARNLVLTHFSARYESVSALAHHMRRSSAVPRGTLKAEVVSRDLQRGEMMRLLDETHSTYGRDSLYLANDFYTFEVEPPAPVPAAQLQQQQAEQAARAAQVQRQAAETAQAMAGRRLGRDWQGEQQWQARGPGGRPQQQQRQRRPGGRGGQGQYQQRRPRPT
ncbi:hypothetical protein CHLNCDRAFT_58404 [Chlorella variabilis]|uniref:SAP domain-containing protein n=1 Tax=Chlorella variabilis TaxID=554065 RepID=E1ZK01_CHLVA|nr:hypothetical protein CHLNCDRAFT_58404 [Chlorella variabilis]EFN53950.1 hypothetical protein CHLNCDRAFT_58404 [Chlorella variabilis]|eukprot:XP_005846052.1 hypothetical protein CHLNCDRAFT_58404 [Chlorella variabilis]